MEKLMKFLCSAVFCIVVALGMPQMARAAEVTINETNFPDEIFRDYVTSKFDKDGNGKLSEEEIIKVTKMRLSGGYREKIKSLKGIEYFTALTLLSCTSHQLTELDVSNNTLLTTLICFGNGLETLNISGNPFLTALYCPNNQLTKLDISNNPSLITLFCACNQLTELDASNNILLKTLSCYSNPLTKLKLNSQTYDTLSLYKTYIHSPSEISDLQNVIEINDLIKVIDITKPATYKINGKDFVILYVNIAISHCTRIFNDYEYKDLVSGTAIILYGNCKKSTDTIKKDCILYTDILASYNYSVDSKGKVKTSTGKVIAGVTMSDTKPTITKNKIIDNEAAKIAKAKIKNGQITVTAIGKAGGVVYLWVMDTGNKGISECCPINVKLAPKKLEVQETTGNKASKLKIANGSSKEVKIAGFVGTTKTEDCTYTAIVDSKSQNYVSVTTLDDKSFTLKGTGLKNDKDTKVSITFTCKENGKKVKFTTTITKSTT